MYLLYSQSLSSLDGQDSDPAAPDDEEDVDAGGGVHRRLSDGGDNVSIPVSVRFNMIHILPLI